MSNFRTFELFRLIYYLHLHFFSNKIHIKHGAVDISGRLLLRNLDLSFM